MFRQLLRKGRQVTASRGATRELRGVLLELTDPRARLSRTELKGTVFSCLGELLWYLSGSNSLDFIKYYIQRYELESGDEKTVHGGYGPRLFNNRGIDQLRNTVALLIDRPSTRRAVIQLFNAEDINEPHKEVPCTCTLQFMIRAGHLHCFTCMRSNDAYFGLPHDIFAFTMLQELIARELSMKLGTYQHAVGSLHLYTDQADEAASYLEEGWQSSISMPEMPLGDPWPAVETVLKAEVAIRNGATINVSTLGLDPYWEDIVRLLQVLQLFKMQKYREIAKTARVMSSRIYETYIRSKQSRPIEVQKKLPFSTET